MDKYGIMKHWIETIDPDSQEATREAETDPRGSTATIYVQKGEKVDVYDSNGEVIEDNEAYPADQPPGGPGLTSMFERMIQNEWVQFGDLDTKAKKMLKDEYGINA